MTRKTEVFGGVGLRINWLSCQNFGLWSAAVLEVALALATQPSAAADEPPPPFRQPNMK